jgi:hypothetical protein
LAKATLKAHAASGGATLGAASAASRSDAMDLDAISLCSAQFGIYHHHCLSLLKFPLALCYFNSLPLLSSHFSLRFYKYRFNRCLSIFIASSYIVIFFGTLSIVSYESL